MKIYKKAKIRYNEINLAYVCMETNSGVVANTLNRILRYKGSTLYRALTVHCCPDFSVDLTGTLVRTTLCCSSHGRKSMTNHNKL